MIEMKIGAQLFTLRKYTQSPEAFAETLRRVAEIGYTTVQVSGTCAYEPEWLASELAKNGLECVITHVPYEKIRDCPEELIKGHTVFGCDYIGLGCGPDAMSTDEAVDSVLELARTSGKVIADAGKLLMYHNHHFEFRRGRNDRSVFCELVSSTDERQLGFTLDTYWLQYGGCDPSEIIGALPGRCPCVHLKDYVISSGEIRMAAVGEGNLNFSRIISACESSGSKYLLVEQDDCYGEDEFACLERSYRYLRAMGLE